MQGYKTVNGYITGKELQQRKVRFKKEMKEYREEKKKEEERKQYINNLLYLEEIKQQKEAIEKAEKLAQEKRIFLDNIKDHNLQYRQFLIAWDIVNSDYYTIKSDYNKGKITKADITKIINIIPTNFITDYHKNLLINL